MIRILSVLLTLFCMSCTERDAQYDETRVKAAAAETLIEYASAITRGDIEKATAFYDNDPDFHWVDRGVLQYNSAAEAGRSLASIIQPGVKPVLELETPYVTDLSESSAVASVRYHFELLESDGAVIFGFDGWMTVGLVERPDGWKIAAGQAGPAQ